MNMYVVLGNLLDPFEFLFFISKVKVSLHFRLLLKRKWSDKYCFWLLVTMPETSSQVTPFQ